MLHAGMRAGLHLAFLRCVAPEVALHRLKSPVEGCRQHEFIAQQSPATES